MRKGAWIRETIERQVEIENWIWEHWIQNTELDAEYFWTHYKRKTNKRIRPKWGPTSKFFHALMDHIGAEELETTPQGKASWNDQVML
ncbi:MAG: hypothetical protein KY432_08755, partial [Acidobacteria bacterium]|nr:hypothetical protein [Acidobacteriota bacterium]